MLVRAQQRAPGAWGLGGSMDEIRRHLLSHFGYYHRLGKLNYRVRDGNGCGLSDKVTGKRRTVRLGTGPPGLLVKWGLSAVSYQLIQISPGRGVPGPKADC